MKIKRQKKVHKAIQFYIYNFGFRQPYQILVDGTLCQAALKNQINLADNIPRYLQGEIKLLTTQCAIIEMENLGPKVKGGLIILKQYAIHKCGHEKKPISGDKCLHSMLGKSNENHYIIGTQDTDLQSAVRNIPGVPLLYLHGNTPVLEKPSQATLQANSDKLAGVSAHERQLIEELKKKNGLVKNEAQSKIRRKKKAKGPNPLSCKKKKKPNAGKITKSAEGTAERDKERRKQHKLPDSVLDETLTNKV